MDPRSVLMPRAEERLAHLDRAARLASGFLDHVPEQPIGPASSRDERERWLGGFDFRTPVPLERLLPEVADQLARGTLLSQHPRCFGLFNPTPAFPGIIADLLTAAVNPQLAVSSHAPAAVEIEAHTIAAVAARIGWPGGTGHFTSGGAEANAAAALLALTAANPAFAERGVSAFERAPVIYASAESHFAWFKIAHQLGIGRRAIRLVPTDGSGRMDPDALSIMIQSDRAATTPAMIAATAGTTNAGMIDPLEDIAGIAAAHGVWLHVDAAWAGALIASRSGRAALAGMERADSATIDAHKWFSVPMGAGMFLTRHPGAAGEAFRVDASYMPPGDGMPDPYVHSAQWSRRFMGLKLFMTLAALGWDGYGAMVDQTLELAARLAQRLESRGWRIENQSPAAVLCFNAPEVEPERIVGRLQASQRVWVSLARFEGRAVVRACPTSFRSGEEDIDVLVDELEDARSAIGAGAV
ncbi:MAG TPA: aminotransferase class V-fold PLP-dependent enzyme [Allosphingosinicella sp.]|jgi:glutamate/tyrosine decarboxylase-like PLP-dependent enzyme